MMKSCRYRKVLWKNLILCDTKDIVCITREKAFSPSAKCWLIFNRIRPGELYSEQDVQNTYSNLGRLRALKYSNIRFREVNGENGTQLDAYVFLAKNKNKSMAFEVEGTNSAGDLGAAASVSFQHRNVFKGSETFMMKVRGA